MTTVMDFLTGAALGLAVLSLVVAIRMKIQTGRAATAARENAAEAERAHATAVRAYDAALRSAAESREKRA